MHCILIGLALAVIGGSTTAAGGSVSQSRGQLLERQVTAGDQSQTFTAYLPAGYDPARRWPLLFVFDPRGRGTFAANLFQPAAERYGWIIVSSDNTRSDGPWEPNARALAALWPHALGRYAVDPRRIYAAGFSGGATVAWVLGANTAQLAGVIAVGQPSQPLVQEGRPAPAWFGAAGRHDFNYRDTLAIRERLARDTDVRTEFFDGAHQWLGEETAMRALAWLEMLAMRDGRRPKDPVLIDETLQRDRRHAAGLEAASRLVEAAATYRALIRTYEGLAGIDDLRAHAAALTGSEPYREAVKADERAAQYEQQHTRKTAQALGELLTSTERVLPARAVQDLRIDALRRDAGRGDAIGDAAARTLESMFVQVAFYLPNELLDKERFHEAALMLEMAAAIHPERPNVWLALARARARAGSTGAAFSALERAVDAGLDDPAILDAERAFDALRSDLRWKRLLARISAGRGAARQSIATALGFDPSRCPVHVTLLGGRSAAEPDRRRDDPIGTQSSRRVSRVATPRRD